MSDKEKSFIQALKNGGATFGIGDDGVNLGDFVIANDAFFENIHFKRSWSSLEATVEKCFVVNLSDIYAMNAIPTFMLLSIGIPKDINATKLATIISNCAKKNGVKIIGGDTILSQTLCFSLTILGKPCKKTLFRSGIKKGDILGYITPSSTLTHKSTQTLGNNAKILKEALRFYKNAKIPPNTRFIKPILYPKMLLCLNKIAKAGMDISDGIFIELERLSSLNHIGFKMLKKPNFWFYSPEEYQMLYAIDSRNLKRIQNHAKKFRHHFMPFAKAKQGKYKSHKKNWHA